MSVYVNNRLRGLNNLVIAIDEYTVINGLLISIKLWISNTTLQQRRLFSAKSDHCSIVLSYFQGTYICFD